MDFELSILPLRHMDFELWYIKIIPLALVELVMIMMIISPVVAAEFYFKI